MRETFLAQKLSPDRGIKVGEYKALRGNVICVVWLYCDLHVGMLKNIRWEKETGDGLLRTVCVGPKYV